MKLSGFEYAGFTAPYTFWSKEGIAVGMCFSCGIVVVGKNITRTVIKDKENISVTNLKKYRWLKRSISELETFINERTPVE